MKLSDHLRKEMCEVLEFLEREREEGFGWEGDQQRIERLKAALESGDDKEAKRVLHGGYKLINVLLGEQATEPGIVYRSETYWKRQLVTFAQHVTSVIGAHWPKAALGDNRPRSKGS
jgi:hypothetical protein